MSLPYILAYIVWDINPDIFTIPIINHPVRWYGLLFAFAFFISQQIMYFIYKTEGRPASEIDMLTIYMAVGTIAGARLGHVLFYDPVHYFENPVKILMVWEGGLASHGGIIGILIALYLFSRKTTVKYLWILDRLAVVIALTCSMIRIGNLMNSEMVGIPTTLPWGFIFTREDNVPRHPAQLYEAIHYFISFVILFWIWNRQREKLKNGFLTSWGLIIMFTFRFIDEFFKIDQVAFEERMTLNMGQLLSLPFILTGILLLIFKVGREQEAFATGNSAIVDREETKTG